MTFQKRLEQLINDAENTIKTLIQTEGVKSEFSYGLVLKIEDENLMFNLGSSRYLIEISEKELIDNSGYTYSYGVLQPEQFMELVDYFRKH